MIFEGARRILEGRVSLAAWTLMFLVASCHAPMVGAQTKDELAGLKEEIDGLKESQRRVLERLVEIEQLLQPSQPRGFAPSDVPVNASPFLGEKNANVTVIEFTDYECAFCAKHFSQVFPRILKEYVETGKVRYIVRQFPLVTLHKAASKASEVSLCAADQGKHWEMHDQMFKNQKALGSKDLKVLVEGIGLDPTRIQECLDAGKYTEKVQEDIALGMKLGVKGTPTFVFGLTEPDGSKIRATKMLTGYVPYAQMSAVLDVLLAKASAAGR